MIESTYTAVKKITQLFPLHSHLKSQTRINSHYYSKRISIVVGNIQKCYQDAVNGVLAEFFKVKLENIVVVLLMFGVLLYPISSWSKVDLELPTGLCGHAYYQCDAKTEQNWLLFQSSTDIQDIKLNFITLGRCSRNGNHNSNVYMLLAVTENSDGLFFSARLSFYNDLSNYKKFNNSEISKIFPDIYDDRNLMIQSDTFAYIDYSDTNPFKYWLRYNQSEKKMIMVAYFGSYYTFLCDFVVHLD